MFACSSKPSPAAGRITLPGGRPPLLAAPAAIARQRSRVSLIIVGATGPPRDGNILSAEQILEIPVERRRKTTAEECPFCADAPIKENDSKCLGICRNLQNVPGPEVFPHEMQEAADAVRLQLNALRDLHVPRQFHGVQVAYEFAVEAGWMERSRYFGYSTDMYHFDHFMGKALCEFEPMIDARGYAIHEPVLREDGRTNVEVEVTSKTGEVSLWTFIMVQRTFGKYKDCWCTHRLLRSDSKWINDV
mmetsp:Transcript_18864/g.47436  ORF Transcript_18864/g.47436 Transcript_18864/m.47436 type:complete len:247 (+) Transcript_18864:130-870(+)